METKCNLPDDLAEEILSWLSVRQLLRFKCVSKSWCAIVDSLRFINKHYERRYIILKEQGDIPMFVKNRCRHNVDISSENTGTQLHLFSKKYEDVLLCGLKNDSAQYHSKIRYFFPLGCANGVVLFKWLVSGDLCLWLWNPATKEFKVLPSHNPHLRSLNRSSNTALGFDPKSSDLKIIASFGNRCDSFVMYSLSTNSWKSIESPSHPQHHVSTWPDTSVYINNVNYWPYFTTKSNFVLSFDFCSETFAFLSLPSFKQEYVFRSPWQCHLGNYKGSLAFIYTPTLIPGVEPKLEIWTMTKVEDHGIPSSWQHLLTAGPFPDHLVVLNSFRVGVDVLIRLQRDNCNSTNRPYESCLYDLATKKITKRFGILFDGCFEYVESLFKLS